jgi:hypothetical protein
MSHPIPTDMEAAKALSCSPAALDLFMWLSYRCFVAKGSSQISGLTTEPRRSSGQYSPPQSERRAFGLRRAECLTMAILC